MRREHTNQIRFIMEELLPPIIRDTALFKLAASLAWGEHISTLAEFRKSAPFGTSEEYDQLYRLHPRVHEDTDNSSPACSGLPRTPSGPASATWAAAPARC